MSARRRWTRREFALLRREYPHQPTSAVAQTLGRSISSVYGQAQLLGVRKTETYLASPSACRLRRGDNVGAAHRFLPGHVPANKGVKGWQAGGRSAETRFRPGHFPANRDPEFYVLGALRVNSDGYIDMRISFEPGARGWRALHRILWEDAHGPVPPGHVVIFANGDKLDCELRNLKLISLVDNMRRNTIYRLPKPLVAAIKTLGQLKRRIREKQNQRPA